MSHETAHIAYKRQADGWLAIRDLARRQHGLVTARQLAALGLARSTIGRWVHDGRLTRVHRGVYAAGHDVLSSEATWMAATLYAGPASGLSHHDGAYYWAIASPSRFPKADPGTIDVVSPTHRRSVPGVRVHLSRTLAHDQIDSRNGIAVTSVARTLLDLGDSLTAYQLAFVMYEAAYRRLLRPRELEQLIARSAGRAAAPRVRRALELYLDGSAGTRSWLEDRTLDLIRIARLPLPQVNVRLLVIDGAVSVLRRGATPPAGACVIEVDMFWQCRGLCIEVDGGGHERPRARARDEERDGKLGGAGVRVIHLSEREIVAAERCGRLPAYVERAIAGTA